MPDRWYYQMLLEEFGPVTTEQLEQLIDEGTLSADDLVRPEDSTKWLTVATRETHLASIAAGPAEIADLSELSFSFEQSDSTRQQAVSSGSNSPDSDTSRLPDRQAPSFFELPEVENDVYYCQSLGQILGPMSLTQLAGMAESGSLSESDSVRCGEAGPWQPAGNISELSATFMLMDHGTSEETMTSRTVQNPSVPDAKVETQPPQHTESIPAKSKSEPVDSTPAQKVTSGESEIPAVRRKVRKRKSKKADDDVLDEIFDDVFAPEEEQKSSRFSSGGPSSAITATSTPVSSDSTAAENAGSAFAASAPDLSQSTAAMRPAPQFSTGVSSPYSSMPSSPMSSAAARPRPYPVHSRSKVGFSFDGPVRVIAIGILLISVLGGLIWQFGLPSFAFGPSVSRIADRIQVAVTNYKALGDKPSQGKWQEFCQATRTEFLPQYQALVTGGFSGKKENACMEGIKGIIAITSMKLDDLERRKELLAKIEKHISEMK